MRFDVSSGSQSLFIRRKSANFLNTRYCGRTVRGQVASLRIIDGHRHLSVVSLTCQPQQTDMDVYAEPLLCPMDAISTCRCRCIDCGIKSKAQQKRSILLLRLLRPGAFASFHIALRGVKMKIMDDPPEPKCAVVIVCFCTYCVPPCVRACYVRTHVRTYRSSSTLVRTRKYM